MRFAERYIESAVAIIQTYDASIPFHHFIKQHFAANKKFGSKDRRSISHACYCYYRLGQLLNNIPVAEKIKAGIFLCTSEPDNWSSAFDEEWLRNWKSVDEKIQFIKSKYSFNEQEIFAWQNELSDALDKPAFTLSHLTQPDLYLRIRPGKERKVIEQLTKAGINLQQNNNCIALPNATRIENIVELNKDVVVQDLSSQSIAEFLPTINGKLSTVKVWDCCAASGGKSILAYDVFKNIELSVSDIRPSIIKNLKKRFAEAGIKEYKSFVADMASENPGLEFLNPGFGLIICDAPCSGSGTWGRTPEQLTFFKTEKISYYSQLQKKIAANAIPYLDKNGYFLYITCSVFKEENEEVVEFIKSNFHLEILKMELLQGYAAKADTMFAALLGKAE